MERIQSIRISVYYVVWWEKGVVRVGDRLPSGVETVTLCV